MIRLFLPFALFMKKIIIIMFFSVSKDDVDHLGFFPPKLDS